MSIDDDQTLSSETLDLFSRIAGRPEVDSSPLDEAKLAAFVCGVCSPEQETELMTSLVRFRDLRTQLKTMQASLETIRATPFGQIAEAGAAPVLVYCMKSAMQSSMRVFCRARRICRSRGWSDICKSDDIEAKTIRSMIGSVGHSIQLMRSYFSGSSNPETTAPHLDESFPMKLSPRLEVQIREDGSLRADLTFHELGKGALAAVKGQTAFLELLDPSGGAVPLSDVPLDGPSTIELEGFSEIAGLEAGLLPAYLFRLVPSDSAPDSPHSPVATTLLFASVQNSDEVVPFQVLEQPRIEKEQLIVELKTPSRAELAAIEPFSLEMLVPSGNVMQLIGRWSPKGWAEDRQALRCSLTGVIDGVLECGSVLHLNLVIA